MSIYKPLSDETLDAIAAAGFAVYMPTAGMQTYAFYTDGTRIAYLQRGYFGGFDLSSVHVPNRNSGTGFRIAEGLGLSDLTRDKLEQAFVTAPAGASTTDRASVVKWRDMEAFLASRGHVALHPVRAATPITTAQEA